MILANVILKFHLLTFKSLYHLLWRWIIIWFVFSEYIFRLMVSSPFLLVLRWSRSIGSEIHWWNISTADYTFGNDPNSYCIPWQRWNWCRISCNNYIFKSKFYRWNDEHTLRWIGGIIWRCHYYDEYDQFQFKSVWLHLAN